MKKVVYPWSFDPITNWHTDIIQRSVDKFDSVIVWVWYNPDKKYMFSFPERVWMIKWVTKSKIENSLKVEVLPFSWLLVDFAYEQWIDTVVRWIRWANDLEGESMLHWVWESQKLWIDTVFMLAKQDQTHISSSTTKAILKEQGIIEDYVSLNVKHSLEARLMWQYLVWLTWVIWAWKSYITNRFIELWEDYWIPVYNIDLDKIGHYILCEATESWYKRIRQDIVSIFWEEVVNENWFIDRNILWKMVFSNIEKRKKLDKILYTPIQVRIRKEMSWKKWILLLNWALIAEAGICKLSNNNLVLVWVNQKIQQVRLTDRGHSSDEIERRVNSQFNTQKKKSIIKNNINNSWYGSLVDFENNWNNEKQIENKFNEILCSIDIYWELRMKSVMKKIWMEDKWLDIYWKIKPMYDTPERLYHNWSHVVNCINKLYEVKEYISEEDFITLFFAIIFHDAVYDSKAKQWENEKNSRILAEKVLSDIWIEKYIISKISELILLTSSHTIYWDDLIWKFMIDIDLAILWQDREVYMDYAKVIRYEYSSYNNEDFKKWRLEFLKGMLKRKIFQTPYFEDKYEKTAKTNIEAEISMLNLM